MTIARSQRLRLLVVQLAQLPFVVLAVWGAPPMSFWLAGAAGSFICCAGTDTRWRWRNRLLVFQAIAWLCVALIFGLDN